MDSDYADDFEASITEGFASSKPNQNLQESKEMKRPNYPASCAALPENNDFQTRFPNNNSRKDPTSTKKTQSVQHIRDDSIPKEREIEDNYEENYSKSSLTPKKRQARNPDNSTNKKRSDRKQRLSVGSASVIEANSAKELEIENNRLRNKLKELSERLSKKLEQTKFTAKKPESISKTEEEKIRNLRREINNAEKILGVNEEEYRKLKGRLDKIKDPQYLIDIDNEIQETLKQIEEAKRENKKLSVNTRASGKALEKMEMIESGDQVKEYDVKAKELIIIMKKLDKLRQKTEGFEDEKITKLEKLQRIKEEYERLVEDKKEGDDTQELEEDDKIERYFELKKRLEIEEIKLKEARRKNHLKAAAERELEEFSENNIKIKEQIADLSETVSNQQDKIKNLTEREGLVNDLNRSQSQSESRIKSGRDIVSKSSVTNITESIGNEVGVDPTSTKNIRPPLYKKTKSGVNDSYTIEGSSGKVEGTSKQRIIIGKLKERRKDSINSKDKSQGKEIKDNQNSKDSSVQQDSEDIIGEKKQLENKEDVSDKNIENVENSTEVKTDLYKKPFIILISSDGEEKDLIADQTFGIPKEVIDQEKKNKDLDPSVGIQNNKQLEDLGTTKKGSNPILDKIDRNTKVYDSLTLPSQKGLSPKILTNDKDLANKGQDAAEILKLPFDVETKTEKEALSLNSIDNSKVNDEKELTPKMEIQEKVNTPKNVLELKGAGLNDMNRMNRVRRGTINAVGSAIGDKIPNKSDTSMISPETGKIESQSKSPQSEQDKLTNTSINKRTYQENHNLEEFPLKDSIPALSDKNNQNQTERNNEKKARDRSHLFKETEAKEQKPISKISIEKEIFLGEDELNKENKAQYASEETGKLNLQGGFGYGFSSVNKNQNNFNDGNILLKETKMNHISNENKENKSFEEKGNRIRISRAKQNTEDLKQKEKNLAIKAEQGNGFFDDLDV